MYGARYGAYRGILYLFPSKSDVTDFSKSRIDPLIEENPDTIAKWIKRTSKDADAANIKRIWDSFLYLRGMKSRVGLKSVPADMIVFDELDEAPQNAVDMAMERMAHSDFKHVLMLSNPTLPDYGIDKQFQNTDQHFWLLKCKKCNRYTNLVDTFPECLVPINGKVIRACVKCGAELDPARGEWIPKKPSVTEKRGYQYSQLYSHYVSPLEILTKFHETDNLTDFYNLKIGIAYVEAENRLNIPQVLKLSADYGNQASDPGPCSMGVDQGKDIHVVIGKRNGQMAGKIVHLGIYKDFEELDALMKNFNVARCIIDALPETRKARELADRFKGKVWLSYYNKHQKGNYSWNELEFIVQSNRTESLDASHREILNEDIILPRHDAGSKNCIVYNFAEHMANIAKKLVEEEVADQKGIKHKTGSKRYIYVKLGPDHFRHAYNYEAMARQFGAKSLFDDCYD